MNVADTIFKQMGGNRFSAMVGVKSLVGGENRLTIRFKAKARDSINCVQVTLTADDLYTVKFFSIRGVNLKEVKEEEGIYGDMLQERFTDVTGLHTRL